MGNHRNMSHNLNSLKEDIWGTIGAIKGDTRSLDSSSYNDNDVSYDTNPLKSLMVIMVY